MIPHRATYDQYLRRRRWALLIVGGVSAAASLFVGVPAWVMALAKGTGFGFGWVASLFVRPAQVWFDRSRLVKLEGEPSGVLRYPRSALIISSICAGSFLIFAILELAAFIVFSQIDGFPLVALIVFGCGSFLFLSAAAYYSLPIAGYYRVRHQLEPTALMYQTFFAKGVVSWDDVARVGYSQQRQSFRLDISDGRVVRVSAMLIGLPEFAVAVMRFVPWCCIDKTARQIIKQTACGHLPRALI